MTVIASIRAPDAERVRRVLETLPPGADPVEIRGDEMSAEEWSACIARCSRPLIATVRGRAQGGGFAGNESERRRRLRLALDAGAWLIDVELDGALADLATGAEAGRVLLSQHGVPCVDGSLEAVLERMCATGAARFKIVAEAKRPAELAALQRLLSRHHGRPLAAFASGRSGVLSRIFATRWGSWGSYAYPAGGRPTAAGQLSVEALRTTFDVDGIGETTRCVALVGSRVGRSPSPAMHAACMRESDLDMRYLPLEIDALDECRPWIEDGTLQGLAVTMPFKEEAASCCATLDEIGSAAGAVNTVLIDGEGWHGFNTDGPAARRLLQAQRDLSGADVAIVGAGGTARAIAAALIEVGCRVTLFNRGQARRVAVATRLNCESRALDELPASGAPILVQATPLGSAGESLPGGLPASAELVLDAVYGAATPLIVSARARGLVAIDGAALLVEQALDQFRLLTRHEANRETLARVCSTWLAQQRSIPEC